MWGPLDSLVGFFYGTYNYSYCMLLWFMNQLITRGPQIVGFSKQHLVGLRHLYSNLKFPPLEGYHLSNPTS